MAKVSAVRILDLECSLEHEVSIFGINVRVIYVKKHSIKQEKIFWNVKHTMLLQDYSITSRYVMSFHFVNKHTPLKNRNNLSTSANWKFDSILE